MPTLVLKEEVALISMDDVKGLYVCDDIGLTYWSFGDYLLASCVMDRGWDGEC